MCQMCWIWWTPHSSTVIFWQQINIMIDMTMPLIPSIFVRLDKTDVEQQSSVESQIFGGFKQIDFVFNLIFGKYWMHIK
jgi:hypothetical protein